MKASDTAEIIVTLNNKTLPKYSLIDGPLSQQFTYTLHQHVLF